MQRNSYKVQFVPSLLREIHRPNSVKVFGDRLCADRTPAESSLSSLAERSAALAGLNA
jgi:hypothetical protein